MRLLLISDLHANMEALHKVVESVRFDEIFCMGDLVDYGPDPLECIDWIRNNKILTIRGNHDNAVALHVDCGCGYVYKHLSEATREYTWAAIGEKEEDFLQNLPLKKELEIDGIRLVLAHGSPESFFDYINPDTPTPKLEEYTKDLNADYLIVGHTHIPTVLKTSTMTILNPGSVGQPRDKNWKTSCTVFDTAKQTYEDIRLEYDIDTTCNKIRSSMPYADKLEAILRRGY